MPVRFILEPSMPSFLAVIDTPELIEHLDIGLDSSNSAISISKTPLAERSSEFAFPAERLYNEVADERSFGTKEGVGSIIIC